MKKVTLSPEALAAINAESPKPLKAPSLPLSKKARAILNEYVREKLFGLSKKPTFKTRLLLYSSFDAIKAMWAADNFQRQMRKKFGTH